MANLRRWAVVFFILALFLLYNRQIPLSPIEREVLTSAYEKTHHIYELQPRYYSRNQIRVSMLASPLSGGPAERINVIYDRKSNSIIATEKEEFGTPLGRWSVRFALLFIFLATWLLYLDPLIAGRYCPTCRSLGVFPRILREKERTVYPSLLDDEGGYTPEIIEKERACPSCSYREVSVREQTVSVQGNLLTELKGNVNVYRSTEENERDIKDLEHRAKTTGISQALHSEHLEQARRAAEAKTTPR